MSITRFYFALTNFCNRSCELCCCYSDPHRSTFIPYPTYLNYLQQGKPYEVQLEGGEPTLHPDFAKMVAYASQDPLCTRIILCTNAVTLPMELEKLHQWLDQFANKAFILKPSINSHLIRHYAKHMEKMKLIAQVFQTHKLLEGSKLTYNVRRIPKPLTNDGEDWITQSIRDAGIAHLCNNFEYQRYGKAANLEALMRPYIIENPVEFHLIAPDGKDFGTDLIARAEYMRLLA